MILNMVEAAKVVTFQLFSYRPINYNFENSRPNDNLMGTSPLVPICPGGPDLIVEIGVENPTRVGTFLNKVYKLIE